MSLIQCYFRAGLRLGLAFALLCAGLAATLAPVSARAQTPEEGAIKGLLVDPLDHPVAGATLTLLAL